MTQYNFSDSRDKQVCDKAFYYNAWLLFGKNNPDKVNSFKTIFDESVESVSTVPFGSNGKYITPNSPGICRTVPNSNKDNLLIEMAGYRNAPTNQHSWLLHEMPHEYCHAFAHIAPQVFSSFPNGKTITDDADGSLKCNNSMGLISERNPITGELIGSHYYGNMARETMMDMITTAGLVAFEPGFAPSNITVDTVFEKHYDNWNDVSTAYTMFTSITRLLIAAFSNNGFVRYQSLVNQGHGIFDAVTITQTGQKLKANDFLYGIMCDPLHIQDEFDKYMGSGAYRLVSKLLDKNFNAYTKTGQMPQEASRDIKLIMDVIPDFLNKKCAYYLEIGMYTQEQTDQIVGKFNVVWNSLQSEYGSYFSQEDINNIARRAGRNVWKKDD